MKRKVLAVLLTAALLMSVLTACGGSKQPAAKETATSEAVKETTDTTESSTESCSDETFTTLQENFAVMTEAYNAVAEAYSSDAVEADADIEDTLNDAQEIIAEMGEITQDTVSEKDADDLNEAMLTILGVLQTVVDNFDIDVSPEYEIGENAYDAQDGSEEGCSDETFAALQESYAAMTEAYNVVVEVYNSDLIEENADIEDTLSAAEDVINEMGEITQDTITEEDADSLNQYMLTILNALDIVVDSM